MPRRRSKKAADPVLIRSAELIGRVLGGLEREIVQTRKRLEQLKEQANVLRARLTPQQRRRFSMGRKRRSVSAEARRRISAVKKRWAKGKRRA